MGFGIWARLNLERCQRQSLPQNLPTEASLSPPVLLRGRPCGAEAIWALGEPRFISRSGPKLRMPPRFSDSNLLSSGS